MIQKQTDKNIQSTSIVKPFYYDTLIDILGTFEEASKIPFFLRDVHSFSEYFPHNCCKHFANVSKRVLKKANNYGVFEYVGWNKDSECADTLNYDPKLNLFFKLGLEINEKEKSWKYNKDAIYLSSKIPDHLDDKNGGMVKYIENENPLVTRFKKACSAPYFREQSDRLFYFYFKKFPVYIKDN